MKKVSFLLAILLMLTMCLPGFADNGQSAEVLTDSAAINGVDVVVVLDCSGSMRKTDSSGRATDGNDIFGNRFDATAMLIGMLDMNTSRIAVVPFGGEVLTSNVIDLQPLNSETRRQSIVDKVYRMPNAGGGTNSGSALMYAINMLQNRTDTSNDAIIILLTDGQNDMRVDGVDGRNYSNVLRYVDDGNGGYRIENRGTVKVTTAVANTITVEAATAAAYYGYPVYTIALGISSSERPSGGLSLQDISTMTHAGNSMQLTSGQANRLPRFFTDILADRIGSSVQYNFQPVLDGTTGSGSNKRYLYYVDIPILNSSVMETNIVIPVAPTDGSDRSQKVTASSHIVAGSIEMVNQNGQSLGAADGVSVLYHAYGMFATIKIRQLAEPGMVRLKFASTQQLSLNSDISFSILYAYDVRLRATVGVLGRTNDGVLYKNDKLELNAFFINGSPDGNGAVTASTDRSLYLDHTGEAGYEDWMTIRVRWALYPRLSNNGTGYSQTPVASGSLDARPTAMKFSNILDLSQVRTTGDLPLSSGEYCFTIEAEGAGLSRRITKEIVLVNHAPEASDQRVEIRVNDPADGQTETFNTQTMTIDLTEYVHDADDATVALDVTENTDVIDYSLGADGKTLTIRTKTVTINGAEKQQPGTADLTVYYDDHDTNGNGNFQLRVTVTSVEQAEFLDRYTPEISVRSGVSAGQDVNGVPQYKKNSPVTVQLRLKDNNTGAYADETVLAQLVATARYDGHEKGSRIEGDAILCELSAEDIGLTAGQHTVTFDVYPFDQQVLTFDVPNTVPVAAVDDTVEIDCGADRLPSFLAVVAGKDTPDDADARNVNGAALFTDADNDRLAYDAPKFYDANGVLYTGALIRAEEVDAGNGTYLLVADDGVTAPFSYSRQIVMKMTVTDADQQTATYTRTITVVSLRNKLITFLIIGTVALIALIVVILILRQLAKPFFPRLRTVIREEPSIFDHPETTPLPHTKKPVRIYAVGVEGDVAEKHAISLKQLQNIALVPMHSKSSVYVVVKGLEARHIISIDDQELKPKKKYMWSTGSDLKIVSTKANDGSYIVVRLIDEDENQAEEQLNQYEDGDWQSSSFETAAAPKQGKRSRRVERTSNPVTNSTQASEPDASSDDDFSF